MRLLSRNQNDVGTGGNVGLRRIDACEELGDGVPALLWAGLEEEVGAFDFCGRDVWADATDAAEGAAPHEAILCGGKAEEGDRAIFEIVGRIDPGGAVDAVCEHERVIGADGAVEVLYGLARGAAAGDEQP